MADRIKAVLLNTECWIQMQIAQALRIRYETVQDHLNDYKNSKKLNPENGGSESHLTPHQTLQLIRLSLRRPFISHLSELTHLGISISSATVLGKNWRAATSVTAETPSLRRCANVFCKSSEF
ncbi:IS630 family transposase domain protein [Candidatus Bealeia paramacronuclearis]|uniref:IS630 family transposase domain protein n=1 Tax=Candidatus Bealeia paramacronuclearis TaxID=1921001 RepID=A0ABZ2C5H3_9PROT|nr:IS630 family transposase domain protein [Candidatus Bealeia paramacronuclearis]